MKSFQYINNMLGERKLAEGGAAPGTEGLFLDPHTPSPGYRGPPGRHPGFIMETARTSGVAFRKAGTLRTICGVRRKCS